jgi:hypothetical protein
MTTSIKHAIQVQMSREIIRAMSFINIFPIGWLLLLTLLQCCMCSEATGRRMSSRAINRKI